MATSLTTTLDRILASDGKTVPLSTYTRLVTYVQSTEVETAHLAYAIRLRGIDGGDGRAAMDRMAADLDRSRSALAQWATAFGYLVTGKVTPTGESFRIARRAYNSTSEGRKHVESVLPRIADAPEAERLGMLQSLATEVATWKKAAGQASAPAGDTTSDDAEDKRTPRVLAGDDVATRTAQWIAMLADVARLAGDGDTSNIVLTSDQADRVEGLLAAIASHVTAATAATV